MAVAGLEEKYDAVRQLIAVGKERGYLLYDEVNDSLPAEVHSSEEIDDLLTTFERNGIEIYEDAASAKAARAVEVSTEPGGDHDVVVVEKEGHSEDGDLDLTPGSLEKTNDPVRMYLREMGTVPLLTREGEVDHRQAHRARATGGDEVHHAVADRYQRIDRRRRGPAQGRALHQRNCRVRRRRAHRRKNRQQDQADAQVHRQDCEAVRNSAEAGRQAR